MTLRHQGRDSRPGGTGTRQRSHGGRLAVALLVATALLSVRARADATIEEAGRGVVSMSFEANHIQGLPTYTVDGYVALLEVDYAFADHWRLHIGVPYVRNRFEGFPPHDPAFLETPHPEAELVDDGDYHGGLQDWRLSLVYSVDRRHSSVAPFVRVELPSRDYPHYGASAIGQNLWRVELGTDFGHQLAFTNFYYGLGYSYTFVEETLGVEVDYHRVPARIGYFLRPSWSLEVFGEAKLGKGREPSDYECGLYGADGRCLRPRLDESWYQHDRQLQHNYVIVGLSTAVGIVRDYSVSLSTWTMVWEESVNSLEYAANVTVARTF